MPLAFRSETLHIPFRDPFRIAREMATKPETAGAEAVTVIVDLWDSADGMEGLVGLGEGFPDTYYGETPESIAAVLPLLVRSIEPALERTRGGDLETARQALADGVDAMARALNRNGAARCAVDTAMHDLVAQRLGVSLTELLGTPAEIAPTDFTIGIDDPAVVAERARAAAERAPFAALKIKVGGASDLETLRAVRDAYAGPIRVDANTGWRPDDAEGLLPELERLGVELIEQPFPAHRLDWLRGLQERSPIPIVTDESSVQIEDLDGLVGVVAGVNVKLAKCGGVGPARRMLDRARELGFRTFLGSMEETRVGIAASVAVAGLAEWLDLDGCLLLSSDPFEGLVLGPDARWQLPGLADRKGLGVRRIAPARPPGI